jgi:putative lipoic acid-binding regulatory protein
LRIRQRPNRNENLSEGRTVHDHDGNGGGESCRKPDIEYPCPWNFTIIGTDGEEIRRRVGELLAGVDYTLQVGRESSGGKYVSLKLTTTVRSEEHRYDLHEKLVQDPLVKVVM